SEMCQMSIIVTCQLYINNNYLTFRTFFPGKGTSPHHPKWKMKSNTYIQNCIRHHNNSTSLSTVLVKITSIATLLIVYEKAHHCRKREIVLLINVFENLNEV
ncbi:unnamed protein product, partial [Leptidea sinapis]